MVCCYKLLVVRSFVLEVKSQSGHHVPVNLHQNKCYSLFLTKTGKVPRSTFTLQAPGLAKRKGSLHGSVTVPRSIHPAPSLHPLASALAQLKRQISAGGALRTKSSDPAQPSSPREPKCTGLNWPSNFLFKLKGI